MAGLGAGAGGSGVEFRVISPGREPNRSRLLPDVPIKYPPKAAAAATRASNCHERRRSGVEGVDGVLGRVSKVFRRGGSDTCGRCGRTKDLDGNGREIVNRFRVIIHRSSGVYRSSARHVSARRTDRLNNGEFAPLQAPARSWGTEDRSACGSSRLLPRRRIRRWRCHRRRMDQQRNLVGVGEERGDDVIVAFVQK